MVDRLPTLFHYGPSDDHAPVSQLQYSRGKEDAGGELDAQAGYAPPSRAGGSPEMNESCGLGFEESTLRMVRNADSGSLVEGVGAIGAEELEGKLFASEAFGSSPRAEDQSARAKSPSKPSPQKLSLKKPPKDPSRKVKKETKPGPPMVVSEAGDKNERLRRGKAEVLARTLREHNAAVFEAQMALLEGPTNEKQLQASRRLLAKPDYDDVIEERAIAGVCGYPLCDNVLPPKSSSKGHYRISLAHKRVFDTSEAVRFCDLNHVVRSGEFRATLEEERPLLPTGEELRAVVAAVTGAGSDGDERERKTGSEDADVTIPSVVEEGSSAGPAVMSATLVERTPVDISADVSVLKRGQPDAIEGYVPRRGGQKRAADKSSQVKSSLLLTSEGAQPGKSGTVRQLKENGRGAEWAGRAQEKGAAESAEVGERTGLRDTDLDWSRRLDHSAAEAGISISRYTEGGKESRESDKPGSVGEHLEKSVEVASSGTTSEPEISQRAAAEKVTRQEQAKQKTVEGGVGKSPSSGADSKTASRQTDAETDLRLQSARAVASALAEAAARVEAGELNEGEAMRSLGMTVQPANEGPPGGDSRSKRWGASTSGMEISGLASDEGAAETSRVKKGLQTGGVLERDGIGSSQTGQGSGRNGSPSRGASVTAEDGEQGDTGQSWMEAPPKGFSAELSQFGQLWMALDSWISADTLRFLHGSERFAGKGGGSRGGVICAGGRDYAPREDLENGASALIRRAFQECVRRAIPDVQRALQLKVPRPELEDVVGDLVRTFNFTDPLPPLKSPGWQLLTMVLLHTLSMQRAPSLSSYFKDGPLIETSIKSIKGEGSEYKLLCEKLVLAGHV